METYILYVKLKNQVIEQCITESFFIKLNTHINWKKKIGCFWKNSYEEINTKLIFCCLLLTAQQQDEFSAHLEGYLGCLE